MSQPSSCGVEDERHYAYWGGSNELLWYVELDGTEGITVTGVYRRGVGITGMGMLQWLRAEHPEDTIYVDGVIIDAIGFYVKAKDRGVIDGFSIEGEGDYDLFELDGGEDY